MARDRSADGRRGGSGRGERKGCSPENSSGEGSGRRGQDEKNSFHSNRRGKEDSKDGGKRFTERNADYKEERRRTEVEKVRCVKRKTGKKVDNKRVKVDIVKVERNRCGGEDGARGGGG